MTGLLLDTHAWLWWLSDDSRLSRAARAGIADIDDDAFVSAASAWEIATLTRLGKLPEAPWIASRFGELAASNGFAHLPVNHRHALRAGGFEAPHRDPFDRMLAAQSEVEDLVLVTRDLAFAHFDVQVLW